MTGIERHWAEVESARIYQENRAMMNAADREVESVSGRFDHSWISESSLDILKRELKPERLPRYDCLPKQRSS